MTLLAPRLDAIKKCSPGISDNEAYINMQKLALSTRRYVAQGTTPP